MDVSLPAVSGPAAGRRRRAFSLIEMLVATAIFVLLVALLLSLISNVSLVWQKSDGQKSRQQAARRALEMISRDLEAAVFPVFSSLPSSLQFQLNPGVTGYQNPSAAFWQATAASDTNGSDLSDVGYFVAWTTNAQSQPVGELRRYLLAATNADSSFQTGTNVITAAKLDEKAPGSTDSSASLGLVAQNVVGLWITLFTVDSSGQTNVYDSGSPYDSKTTADRPTSAEVAVVVMDPRLAGRLPNPSSISALYTNSADAFATALNQQIGNGAQVYKTRVLLPAAHP